MRPDLIVVPPPFLDHLAGMLQTDKPVRVQALVPKSPVEALDVGVLHGLAGPDKAELHTLPVDSLIEDPPGASSLGLSMI